MHLKWVLTLHKNKKTYVKTHSFNSSNIVTWTWFFFFQFAKEDAVLMLVGNKNDKETKRQIEYRQGQQVKSAWREIKNN